MASVTVSPSAGSMASFFVVAEETPPTTARGLRGEPVEDAVPSATSGDLDRLAVGMAFARDEGALSLRGRAAIFRPIDSTASPVSLQGSILPVVAGSADAALPRSTTTSTQPTPFQSAPAAPLTPPNPQSSASRRECQASRASLRTVATPPEGFPCHGISSSPAAIRLGAISVTAESRAPSLPVMAGRTIAGGELREAAYSRYPEPLVQFAARVAVEIASRMPPQPPPVVHIHVLPSVAPESRSKKFANITTAISSLALSAVGFGIWRQLRPQAFIEASTLAAEKTLANLLVSFADTAAQKGSEAARAAIPELSAALRPPLELLATNAGAVSGKKAAELILLNIPKLRTPTGTPNSWWQYVLTPWRLFY